MPIIPEWIVDEARYRWERLAIREKINSIDPQNIYIITIISLFILLTVIILLLWPNKKQVVQDYKKAWFYDLNTGQLFIDRNSKIPPVEAPSGPQPDGSAAGVKVYVYSYVAEPADADRIIGFLWKPDPQAAGSSEDTADQWVVGKLIKRPKDKNWVSADSEKGRNIIKEVFKKNKDGVQPRYCFPK